MDELKLTLNETDRVLKLLQRRRKELKGYLRIEEIQELFPEYKAEVLIPYLLYRGLLEEKPPHGVESFFDVIN